MGIEQSLIEIQLNHYRQQPFISIWLLLSYGTTLSDEITSLKKTFCD